jgi:membrane protein YdbS with pleckstrin-like domain
VVPISRRALADDEDVLVDVRLHWLFFVGPALLTAVAVGVAVAVVAKFPSAPVGVAWVLVAMVALPALWLVGRALRWRGISLVVTTVRLIYRQGLFGQDVVQVRLLRVSEVNSAQTLFGRMFGTGRLVIGITGEEPMVIHDVRRPRALQRVINRQLDALMAGWSAAPPINGSDAPTFPPSAPRAASIEDTPPHGAIVFPSPVPYSTPTPVGATLPTTGVPGASIPEQLIQLDDLRQRGIITASEFEAKKIELLSRL